MVGSKKTLPTLRGMVLSLNVTNKTVRDNYLHSFSDQFGGQQKHVGSPTTPLKFFQINLVGNKNT
ncbi:MAG: hypothetical protein DRR16_21335 [Candidatus Parabeggiatoa sp. nov. 3]|nr:MAG: hypothetical protein DRR00_19030 [Gammaproteobacteria bacterium]RKZ66068.1 MAG: hypothetical protein DRQ99_10875 [Gammaproteobacteria bacterium]RKZ81786.1 MAG: hypothetical protein DRR16_21335 [Gammaproteobacteria bacterium]HEW97466.1 hypothetical protein [Beggiatoa sp.]